MAATFNPSMIMTSDFYQENYSDDMGPSSKDIERVLGIKLEPDLANFVDYIDYSPGNILYEKRDDGSYNFSLIDINRMKFCDVDMQTGCANFARMWGSDQFFETIAYAYAKERGWDEKICKKIVFEARDEDRKQRKKKEEFKKKIRSLLKK